MKGLAFTVPAVLLASCGNVTHTEASTATITQTSAPQHTVTQPASRIPPPPAAPKTVISADGNSLTIIDLDGVFVVGEVDVTPGKYRNAGGTNCYWARLRSVDPGDIVDSKQTDSPQVIVIRASDSAFLTQNCGTWQMISLF